jgi:hypothetical protein
VSIPESARESGDVSWLNGCWSSRSNLYNSRTRSPLGYEYCFDGKGEGRVSIDVKDAEGNKVDHCTGTAHARMEDGRLVVEEDGRPVCEEGGAYYATTIVCTPGDDRTECAVDQEGRRMDSNTGFSRRE